MIPITKSAKPPILIQHEALWTQEYCDLKAQQMKDSTIESRHRHREIKAALLEETQDKCAYCEQKISSSQFGDVEHILPKQDFPNLYVSWENLTIACEVCNNAKGTKVGIISPYTEDPGLHLKFIGPMVSHRAGSPSGEITWKSVGLNRDALVLRRIRFLVKLQSLIDRWEALPHGPLKDGVRDEIHSWADKSEEFSATARSFIEDAGVV